ncbi:amyloid-beta A4 precursor protein-binding family A member 2-like isoform X15 [Haliotis rufescens]|uniref:amyloid-beta A4 precursor protein-binding family A member 2-like isoform X15 n=1 Tax=Haliotis rufescens TaxID=6454 RepID=UPI00201E9B1A|nr:amyloid-beta A4 precursor protein-binding family A member 2-like isoform X15 [Haliotis rufescens]
MTTHEGYVEVKDIIHCDMDGGDTVDGARGGGSPKHQLMVSMSEFSESMIDDGADNISMEVQMGEEGSRHPSEISSISYQNLLEDADAGSTSLSRRDSEDSNDSYQPDDPDGIADFPPEDIERFESSDLPLSEHYAVARKSESTNQSSNKATKQSDFSPEENGGENLSVCSDKHYDNVPITITGEEDDADVSENGSYDSKTNVILRRKASSSENVRELNDVMDAVKKRNSLEIRNNIPTIGQIKTYDKDIDDITYNAQGAKPKIRKQSPGLARRVCDRPMGSGSDREGSSSEREMERIENHLEPNLPRALGLELSGEPTVGVIENGKDGIQIIAPRKNLNIENEYDYVKYARVQKGNSYVGMRLAYSSSSDSLNLKRNSMNSQDSGSLDSSRETSPEKILQQKILQDLGVPAPTERVNEDSLTEIPLNGTDGNMVDDRKSFTLSPENTECDSVEVESVMSDGDRSTLGMPMVDDGLSSSQASDVEDMGNHDSSIPSEILKQRQKQDIEQELKNSEDKDHSESRNKEMDAQAIMNDLKAKREALDMAIADIKSAIQRSKGVALQSSYQQEDSTNEPVWVKRDPNIQKMQQRQEEMRRVREEIERQQEEEYAKQEQEKVVRSTDSDTDEETDRLLQKQYQRRDQYVEIPELSEPPVNRSAQAEKRRSRAKEGEQESLHVRDPDNPEVLIEGVLFRARYLGSTQLVSEGQPSKAMRMMQAQEAVGRIKASTLGSLHFGEKYQAPEGENQPSTDVDLFVSTEKIMVLNTDLQEIMMDHSLRTISYIADIGDILVIMARRRLITSPDSESLRRRRQAKILCHVFESDEAQLIAQSIGQAFQVAYMEFLKANGIEDPGILKEMDYQDVLNQQEIYGEELNLFANKDYHKEVIVPKTKGEPLGVVIVESGWGSMVPTVVLANMMPTGPAARCGQLNIGDQIISINGISLVGLPLSACQNQIKTSKPQTVVKLTVVPCPPVVEVLIKRPDVKYQLGFSVQNGVICSLLRGGIAERGGVRVGHRIIEINNQSVVAVPHEKIVALLANSVGEIHMKTMPTSIYRLLTGQDTPHYL